MNRLSGAIITCALLVQVMMASAKKAPITCALVTFCPFLLHQSRRNRMIDPRVVPLHEHATKQMFEIHFLSASS